MLDDQNYVLDAGGQAALDASRAQAFSKARRRERPNMFGVDAEPVFDTALLQPLGQGLEIAPIVLARQR